MPGNSNDSALGEKGSPRKSLRDPHTVENIYIWSAPAASNTFENSTFDQLPNDLFNPSADPFKGQANPGQIALKMEPKNPPNIAPRITVCPRPALLNALLPCWLSGPPNPLLRNERQGILRTSPSRELLLDILKTGNFKELYKIEEL